MAVSKNRRKKEKKYNANKNKRKNSMSRLVEESRQQFMGQYHNLRNALAQLNELVNQYNLLNWATDTREDIKATADEKFNRYVPIINEAGESLENIHAVHSLARKEYSEGRMSPEDLNWKYIELHEKLLNVTNHIGYLIETGVADMEVAFNAKYAYRG